MFTQDFFDSTTKDDPLGRQKLGQALKVIANSKILNRLSEQLLADMVKGVGLNDSDNEILVRVRETRIQIAVLLTLQDDLSQLELKDDSDA